MTAAMVADKMPRWLVGSDCDWPCCVGRKACSCSEGSSQLLVDAGNTSDRPPTFEREGHGPATDGIAGQRVAYPIEGVA